MASVTLCDFQSKAEVSKIEEQMKKLLNEVDIAHTNFTRLLNFDVSYLVLQEEELAISEKLSIARNATNEISKETGFPEVLCRLPSLRLEEVGLVVYAVQLTTKYTLFKMKPLRSKDMFKNAKAGKGFLRKHFVIWKANYIVLSSISNYVECNSDLAKEDIDAIEKAERELLSTEEKLQSAEAEKVHYEGVMHNKVLHDINEAEAECEKLQEKRQACQKALDLRWCKFQRNATLLKRQLTWQYVKMPQDASATTVRDIKGLSGLVLLPYYCASGERSFSTLCFALALHEMTEAPFRAMDEFDVFMDAVSRKMSLETLVDFAVTQGSQWIFITPHDISMVKPGERVRKQQIAAPRG
ncbi:hypothetical protein BHE74_00005919 [Ensete ventricosum]|nr:hypothetical protein BHE74_00005919 [Ensete ventricosum]RZR84895.1 hypothetical protein BHM03_00011789 [Ensete ventricosum]